MNNLRPQLPPKFELFFLFELGELETFLKCSFILQRRRSSPVPNVTRNNQHLSAEQWRGGSSPPHPRSDTFSFLFYVNCSNSTSPRPYPAHQMLIYISRMWSIKRKDRILCHCSSNFQGRHGGRQPEQALLGFTEMNVPPRAIKYECCSGSVTKKSEKPMWKCLLSELKCLKSWL